MAGETSSTVAGAIPLSGRVADDVRDLVTAATVYRRMGPVVRIRFPVKNVAVEVRHFLGEIPDGWKQCNWDCHVKRAPGVLWTKELAYLISDTDFSNYECAFGMYRDAVKEANAT